MDPAIAFQPYTTTIYSNEVDLQKTLDLTIVKGKTILVTGGASGLGAAVAKYWAQNGANMMIGDVNVKLGVELVADLRKSTGNDNHQFFECDVTEWQSQARFFKEAAKASPHGGIDVVVANAGIADGNECRLFEEPPDYSQMDDPLEPQITRTIDVNLKGVYFTTHLALSYLPRNPGTQSCSLEPESTDRDRQLILIASVAGIAPLPRIASYCSAKHGVVGLFRALRITAPIAHGVRVNMINPYFVKTAIHGLGGNLIMAGGGWAEVDDVVDILTRFVTDHGIIGRGCVIGPTGDEGQAVALGLPHKGPVWDVYADDFQQTDIFTRRIVGITNLRVHARGWIGMYKELFMAFASPILGRFAG